MFELAIAVGTGVVNTYNYLTSKNTNAPANTTADPKNTKDWNPEGPTILTELWMLTLYPSGTKLHFESHHIAHDCPDDGYIPQFLKRPFKGDKREDLRKLKKAVKIAIHICPPSVTGHSSIEQMESSPNLPSINRVYLGARKGLLKLATTYRYTIDLEEFKKTAAQDSLFISQKIKVDKTDKNYIARKAITRCINFIDRALLIGVKKSDLTEISKRVQKNWQPGDFDAIVLDMTNAMKEIKNNPNSPVLPCANEVAMLQGRLNGKISKFVLGIDACTEHGASMRPPSPPSTHNTPKLPPPPQVTPPPPQVSPQVPPPPPQVSPPPAAAAKSPAAPKPPAAAEKPSSVAPVVNQGDDEY